MTLMIRNLIIFLFIGLLSNTAFGFFQCKVLDSNLNKEYKGECKKGLAHGKGQAWGEKDSYQGDFKKGFPHGQGTYTWEDGSTYTGEFSNGKMDGEGQLTKIGGFGNKQIKKGFFKNGEYIGENKYPYKVVSKQGVRNITFQEIPANINEVRLKIISNGILTSPGDLIVRDDNNTIVEKRNGMIILNNIQFPLKRVNLKFSLNSVSCQVTFDIYHAGTWEVQISI